MKFATLASMLTLSAGLAACGGTGTGNPLAKDDVTLQSAPYVTVSHLDLIRSWFLPDAYASSVTDFRFCITKLKLKDESLQPVLTDGAESIEVALGLIDVSSASSVTTWGTLEIPVGFRLGRLEVELHKDAEKCSGANFSLSYNGTALNKDLELRFRFNPAVTVEAGDVLNLGLTPIYQAIVDAQNAGKLNDEQISEYLHDSLEGTGSDDD